jgi:hypothetical protein
MLLRPRPDVVCELGLYGIYHDDALIERHFRDLATNVAPAQIVCNVILNRVKDCQEVVRIFCATANPVEVIVAQTEQGRGVLGVIDGSSPAGVEKEEHAKARHALLRKFGYKR